MCINQVVHQLRRMSLRIRRSRFGKRESWSSCTSDETNAHHAVAATGEHLPKPLAASVRTKKTPTAAAVIEQELGTVHSNFLLLSITG